MLRADREIARHAHQVASNEIMGILDQFFLCQPVDQGNDRARADEGKHEAAEALDERMSALEQHADLEFVFDELDEVPDPGQVQPAPPVAPAIDYAELVAELVRAGLVVASKPVPPVVVSEVAAPQIAAPAPTSHEAAEPAPPPVASAPVVPDLAMTPKPESQKAAEPVPMALASVVAPKPVPTPSAPIIGGVVKQPCVK